MNKYWWLVVAVVLIGGLAYGTTIASAYPGSGMSQTIIQRLVERFNLSEAEVEQVFDEAHGEMHGQMMRVEGRLDQAVEDGKLTEPQKQLILAKQQELRDQFEANRSVFKDMTPEQRREAMQKQRQDLIEWADQNNIDLKYLFGFGAMGRGQMKGHGWGMGMTEG